MSEMSCTICGAPSPDAEVCPWCTAANFPPPEDIPLPWWQEVRLPLAPCRDGIRAMSRREEPPP